MSDIKIYHVETQEDYDDLMVKLEEQGYKWISGDKPTNKPEYWGYRKENTTVLLNGFQNYRMTRGALDYHKRTYPFTTVIKHKAKGVEQMEKVVVPQFVADWYEGYRYKSLRLVLNHLMNCRDQRIMEWVDKNSPTSAQEIIAKMHLFQNYEVEQEKRYYWRKKKEYMFEFEDDDYIYLNIEKDTGEIYFSSKKNFDNFQTVLTEKEAKQAIGVNDFNKLERVEIDAK